MKEKFQQLFGFEMSKETIAQAVEKAEIVWDEGDTVLGYKISILESYGYMFDGNDHEVCNFLGIKFVDSNTLSHFFMEMNHQIQFYAPNGWRLEIGIFGFWNYLGLFAFPEREYQELSHDDICGGCPECSSNIRGFSIFS